MTNTEIQNQLVGFFLKNDTFKIPEDYKKIKVSKNQEDIKEALVKNALNELVLTKFLHLIRKEDENKTVAYILNYPLGFEGQEVKISMQTAEALGELLNQYKEALNLKDQAPTDKLNINDFDIQQLVVICAQLLNNQDTEKEDE
jgi:ERCC4-type nuclease